jgi:hypothetical protein
MPFSVNPELSTHLPNKQGLRLAYRHAIDESITVASQMSQSIQMQKGHEALMAYAESMQKLDNEQKTRLTVHLGGDPKVPGIYDLDGWVKFQKTFPESLVTLETENFIRASQTAGAPDYLLEKYQKLIQQTERIMKRFQHKPPIANEEAPWFAKLRNFFKF